VVLTAGAICHARVHPSVALRDTIAKVARSRSTHLSIAEANAFATRCVDLYNVLIMPQYLIVQRQPPRGATTNLLEIDDETDSESLERRHAPVVERAPRQPRASSVRAAQTIKSFANDADADNAAEPATPVVSARTTRRRASAAATPPPTGTPSTPRRSSRSRKPTTQN
jgi:hypothetical protein